MIEEHLGIEDGARSRLHPIARGEWAAVLVSSAAASLLAILWSWQHHALLNYGDAVAHLNIARRVFDSHLPRFSELGSVWLPLPHILMLPFVQVYAWWADGLAGAIPSEFAYIAACTGFYRLARHWLAPAAAALALVFFAANPNLLYMQTTAMTEPLFLCEMVWISAWLVQWRMTLDTQQRSDARMLWAIALTLVAAVYTRYDGWIMALLAWVAVGIALLRHGMLRSKAFWLASAVVVAAPLLWFAYNSSAFGDWLFFQRGPYSAKAIELRTATPGDTLRPDSLHPGFHDPWMSLLFYGKAAEMDAAPEPWGTVLLAVCALGAMHAWARARRKHLTWALLLALPIPFYAYSVSYGYVPIFLPVWWPHSWYNVRYGMELLPWLALCIGFVSQRCLDAIENLKPGNAAWARGAFLGLAVILALNVCGMLRERPLAYVEGTKNHEAHGPYEQAIPPVLRAWLKQRPDGEILMLTSYDPEIVARTGIPLRQTINESDLSFYTDALAAPAAHAALVLAWDGDDVDKAVHAHPQGLRAVAHFTTHGEPSVTLYVSDTPGA